jgi:hypothetical protein
VHHVLSNRLNCACVTKNPALLLMFAISQEERRINTPMEAH